MKNDYLLKNYSEFVHKIFSEKSQELRQNLNNQNISILDDFINNFEVINEFYNKYITPNNPKVIICGINPGRFGAGKTGIAFLDFSSVSKLINNINRTDTERSAQFFYNIIEKFTPENFYKHFYVTNISCLGFKIKKKRWVNLNYYSLPLEIKNIFINNFLNEVNYLKPKYIISCSGEVHKTLCELKKNNLLNCNIEITLQHPYWCSIKKNYEFGFNRYINELEKFI
jgi:hypothetical protein